MGLGRVAQELPTESLESCGSQNQGGGSSTSNQHEHDKLPAEQWDWDRLRQNSQRNRRNHAVHKIRPPGVQHQINVNTINSHNRFRRHAGAPRISNALNQDLIRSNERLTRTRGVLPRDEGIRANSHSGQSINMLRNMLRPDFATNRHKSRSPYKLVTRSRPSA